MKTVTIKKGWFYGAGSVYGWTAKFHIYGVGIAVEVLKENESIIIKIAGSVFTLDCKLAIRFAQHYNSFKTMRGRRLAIVSKSILKVYEGKK